MENTLSKCRSGCKTQDHANWGECARAANLSISNEVASLAIKKTDKELSAYRDARKLGIQPASTQMKDIQKAVRVSEKIGKAAQA
jgi:hypothetical protein